MSGTGLSQARGRFRAVAAEKLADTRVQGAIDTATGRFYTAREKAWAELEDVEELRERARDIRTRTIDDLERHLADFTRTLESRGGHVHRCTTPEEARDVVVGICRRANAKLAVKSKSMASEEIKLNDALAEIGVKAVEGDLGEYIIQLAGEHPKHIIAPALEKTAGEVAELFSAVEGRKVSSDLVELQRTARLQLRNVFLTADVGITGANFGVAETGSICLVTNEGNGRMATSLPRVHIALMGMERVVPTLAELAVLLKLLARSATGQRLSSYTTLVTGPRRAGETDGPEELHVVILDNGRSQLLGGRYREMLNCIRCGACLNVCPVYRKTGGGAYGPVYSGPMGAVLVPLLVGLERAPDHPHASSLCGACTAACPVKIPLHELLLELRRDLVAEGVAPLRERLAFWAWSAAWSRPWAYRVSTRAARLGQRFGGLVGPGRTWAAGRELPSLVSRRFRDR
ncbi:MAG: iron-sulfur cluster-binding protein [Actinobacteria bacterium]|nr:iron-sulfur cluster-binding protein [Actinomycetota bacterium]